MESNGQQATKNTLVSLKQLIAEASQQCTLGFTDRCFRDYDLVSDLVKLLRLVGCRMVLTSGSFDLVHIGHARYLREAKRSGDILIVGVDDDIKARGRKGDNRPVVPEDERLEMLTHLRWVDLVVLKSHVDAEWQLIKAVAPEVLILVEGTYGEEKLGKLKALVGDVKILPRQAETSTSAKIRRMMLGGADVIREAVAKAYDQIGGGQ